MIVSNIKVNENKLEEFVRVLLSEEYDILKANSEKNIYFEICENFGKIDVVAILTKEKNFNNYKNNKNSEIKIEICENFKIKNVEKNIEEKNILKKITFSYEKICDKYFDQAEVMLKTSIFKIFEKEKDFKWGTLIGVRPTKIVGRFLKMGLSYEKILEILRDIYLVSDEKRNLLINIAKKQQKYLDKDTIGIYIGIAFCPTKCTYCSFPAYLLNGKYAARYDEYIEDIYKETKEIGKLSQELNLKINTIYIGGGTPSILSAEEIKKLLDMIKENYDLSHLKEFTFEAGRIDTLNQKKLQVLKQGGVDKISINPQSFNEKTLKLVNRYHDRKQFDKVYKLAKEMGLSINMDLILGLPKETTQDILYTLDEVTKYDVENLTIHNLAIKNASKLNKENYEHRDTLDYKTIFEKISKITENKGLFPYYMYRQKNSFQWGENLGYSLKNCESIYNIEMIEENKTIIGIGAGAITKLIWTDENTKKDNIKRLVNPKDPLVWMNELEIRLEIKKEKIREISKKL